MPNKQSFLLLQHLQLNARATLAKVSTEVYWMSVALITSVITVEMHITHRASRIHTAKIGVSYET